jgi:hypothetical protein
MTATAYPFGMAPSLQLAQAYNTQGFSTFPILDGYTTSIFFGDVVKLDPSASGYLQKDTGTTTATPQGVFVGCSYVQPTTGYFVNAQCWPASTTTGVTSGAGAPQGLVVNDPNAVFSIQADATLTRAALGQNAALVQTAGTTAIGKSRNALSASSVADTSTLPLRIVGLLDIPDNDWTSTYPIVLVKFNNHQLTTTTGA